MKNKTLKHQLGEKLKRGNDGSFEKDAAAIRSAFDEWTVAIGPGQTVGDIAARFAIFVLYAFHGSGDAAAGVCDRPPIGWHCTRGTGHAGPCAAVPIDEPADVKFHADDYPANIGDCQSPPAQAIRDDLTKVNNQESEFVMYGGTRQGGKSFAAGQPVHCLQCGESLFEHGGHPFVFPSKPGFNLDQELTHIAGLKAAIEGTGDESGLVQHWDEPAPGVEYYDGGDVPFHARICSQCRRYFTGPAKLDAQETFCSGVCQNLFYEIGKGSATPSATLSPAVLPGLGTAEKKTTCAQCTGRLPSIAFAGYFPNIGPRDFCSAGCLSYYAAGVLMAKSNV